MAEEKKKREKKSSLWLFGCLVMIVFGCITGLFSLALGIGNLSFDIFLSYFKLPVLLLFNVLPSVLLHLAFYMLFGRPWLAFFFGSGIVLGAGVLQGFKIWLEKDVFYLSDLFSGDPLRFLPDLSGVQLNWVMIGTLIYFVFGIVFLIILFRRRKAPWLAGRLVGMLVFLCLFYPYNREASNVEKYAEYTDNSAVVTDDSELMRYVSKGFLYPFVLTAENSGEKQTPGGYQESRARQMLAQYESSDIPADRTADIIAVQLSGFEDLSGCGAAGIDFTSVYAPYHELKNSSFSGKLYAKDIGDGSLDCAKSFLMGSIAPGIIRKNTNSYVWYMQGQGFGTFAVSARELAADSRNRTYASLGFNKLSFRSEEVDAADRNGLSDWWLFGEIMKQYGMGALKDGGRFVFAESVQNAGQRGADAAGTEDFTDGSYEPEIRNRINAYLSGVKDTLFYINNLIKQLEETKRPVVLLLYGSGYPDLGADVYAALGIETELDTAEAKAVRCSAEYLIWMNGAAKQQFAEAKTGKGPDISVNYLMAELFGYLGWEGPGFMKASREMMQTLPALSSEGFCLFGGKITELSQLPLDAQSALHNYEYIEYYWEDHFGLAK